jgi:hypothetical protein
VKLSPQPEPPDFPADPYELLLEELFGFPPYFDQVK